MAVELEIALREWEDGYRRLQEAGGDSSQRILLDRHVELVTAELRRRIGSTFTLGELARAYDDADRWAREVVGEHAPTPGWPRTLALVQAAAFHLYARGAVDYQP